MKQLSLYYSAEFTIPALVSFIGAGGKTTLMLRLAEELVAAGHKVIITTTTKIYPPDNLPLVLASSLNLALTALTKILDKQNIVVLGRSIGTDAKLQGLNPDIVNCIFKELGVFVVVEADGASGKPLKGYKDCEPLIPSGSDLVFAVIGADILGKRADETHIHRFASFSAATGIDSGKVITSIILAKSYRQMHNIAISQAPAAECQAILNKSDLLIMPGKTALDLHDHLVNETGSYKNLLLTTAQDANPVKIILSAEPRKPAVAVAAIVLAAGLSKRMGEDKLSLKIGGNTVFETTLKAILKAGADQVIVVTKPGSSHVYGSGRFNCQEVENQTPEQGLSSSLKAGLAAVDSTIQGALFALADQPQITSELYRLLLDSYRKNLKPVTCPLYRGKRGNPTIFDRRTWASLEQIEGDQGGRSLLENLAGEQVDFVTVDDPAVITDLDTPADYTRLRDQDNQ